MNRQRHLVGFMLASVFAGCSSAEPIADSTGGKIESRGMPQMQAKPSMPGPSAAQLPTFPQKFDVQGSEFDSFGFAVTQPGSIVVDVQAQSAPVAVTLQSSGGQPITQQGTRNVRLNYAVPPQDVQRSLFWHAQLRLAQPMPPQHGGRASGNVNVQFPPVNHAQVQAAIAVRQQVAQQQAAQQQAQAQQAGSQAAAQMEQAFQQRKAQFEQQQQQRHAALMTQIQPQLVQLQGRMGSQAPAWTKGGGASVGYGSEGGQVRPRGIEGGNSPENAEPVGEQVDEIGTRALKPAGAPLMQAPTGARPPMMSTIPQTATSQQALDSAGSGPPPQQVVSNPIITSLSVAEGQPGAPVMINGSSFGNGGGEIHFVIGPGKDISASAGVVWTDNQIFATVPNATGVMGFNGTIYVRRAGETITSNLVPFRFDPWLELRQMTLVHLPESDYILEQFNSVSVEVSSIGVRRRHSNPFWGPKGNDRCFINTQLKNSWVVAQAPDIYFPGPYATDGGAYLWESRAGTASPFVNVRFWLPGSGITNFMEQRYQVYISIQGPKGVPDGIVCKQAPCP